MKEKTSKTKALFSRIFKIRQWSDWDRIRAGGAAMVDAAQKLFVLSPMKGTESFTEAQRKMKLTDADLAARAQALWTWSLFMFILGVLLFGYTFYHLFFGSIPASILTLSLTMLSFSLSFRYHFWYFQIKARKLGCSFQDWYQYVLKGKKL